MIRVLVPLDGTHFAESIIPDARRLAGQQGELVLVRDASVPSYDSHLRTAAGTRTIHESQEYLDHLAHRLREQGVRVRVETTFMHDIALAIDEMSEIFSVDMIVCATHGRGIAGRLIHGGAAWRAVAGSRVPVLLRHVEEPVSLELEIAGPRHIMVPLDGSKTAECALPLAERLAREWGADIVLVRVISIAAPQYGPYLTAQPYPVDLSAEVRDAETYLDATAGDLNVPVRTHAYSGPVEDRLVDAVERHAITDVVMASHGRTGLSRAILGSVADGLVHKLHLPIIVIPALAAGRSTEQETQETASGEPAHV